jgi:Domain of unknown function (DUF4048)
MASTTMTLPPTMAAIDPSTSPFLHEKSQRQSHGLSRPSKRLTLNFPILPPTQQPDCHHSPSPNRKTSAELVRSSPRRPTTVGSPTESNSFLTSLAAQERRVLELREELQKAEADLSHLKRQWSQFEAGRKKNELRHVELLQHLPGTQPTVLDFQSENGANPAAALRASLENGTDRPVVRKSTQRLFSGSRQTRALSLLSPDALSSRSTQARPFEKALSPTVTTTDIHSKHAPLSTPMSSTEETIGFGRTYKQLAVRRSMPPPAKDVIMESGKKMAADLRVGLFTFFEDIRQATVGDECINGVETRTAGAARAQPQGPRSRHESEQAIHRTTNRQKNKKEGQKEVEPYEAPRGKGTPSSGPKRSKSFWDEFGLETPSIKHTNNTSPPIEQSKPEATSSLLQIDDGWDTWDSPIPPQRSPKHDVPANETPATDSIPWPELTKRTPVKMSRTVSDLMKDWESPAVSSCKRSAGLDDQAIASPHI